MKSEKLRKLVFTALFAALTCTVTAALPIRSPLGGYFNLGDTVILLGAFLLGPVCGAAAGGVGAALADLLLGYGIYAPVTLAVKVLVALTAGLIYLRAKERGKFPFVLLAAVAGEMVMAGGYFLFELFYLGAAASAQSLLFTNLPQAAVSVVAAFALYLVLDKAKVLGRVRFHA